MACGTQCSGNVNDSCGVQRTCNLTVCGGGTAVCFNTMCCTPKTQGNGCGTGAAGSGCSTMTSRTRAAATLTAPASARDGHGLLLGGASGKCCNTMATACGGTGGTGTKVLRHGERRLRQHDQLRADVQWQRRVPWHRRLPVTHVG